MFLYADTGSKFTIITPEQYREDRGEVVAADTRLRAWGAKGYLDVKGMFQTTLRLDKGANKETWVYVVDGYRPEALLGDRDAEDLGIISLHKDGREETQVRLMVGDLRLSGIRSQQAGRRACRPPWGRGASPWLSLTSSKARLSLTRSGR